MFSRGVTIVCAVDNWPTGSRAISTGWLLVWILSGSALLGAHSPLVGAGYLLIWVLQYVHCRYLACTRCYYCGKRCKNSLCPLNAAPRG